MMSLFRSYSYMLSIAAILALTAHALTTRDTTSDIATIKGGVLVKNGKQTSCELGVIDSMSAFVAAPCLDFSGTTVNMDTAYEVYLDTGIDNTAAKYAVNTITVHPDYDSTSNTNPIAVLQFNKGSTETWSNPIAVAQSYSWDNLLYVSRGMTDMASMVWKTPGTYPATYEFARDCNYQTNVFQANINDLLCTNATTSPPNAYLTNCAIPYGSVDAYVSGKLYIAGMYAYTNLEVMSMQCSLNTEQDSVYLLFADYIAFASNILGRSISNSPAPNGWAPQSDSNYAMITPNSMTLIATIDGDFYASQQDPPAAASSSSATSGVDKNNNNSGSTTEFQSSTSAANFVSSTNANTIAGGNAGAFASADADTTSGSDTDTIAGSSADIITGADTDDITDTDDNSISDYGSDNDPVYASASEASSELSKEDGGGLSNSQAKSSKKAIAIGVVCSILGAIILTSLSLYAYKRWRRARMGASSGWKTLSGNYSTRMVDISDIYVPPYVYTPSKSLLKSPPQAPAPLRHAPSAQSNINGFDRDIFNALEYYLPPLHEPNTRSSLSSVSSQSTISSFSSESSVLSASSQSSQSSQSSLSTLSASPSSIYQLYRYT